MGHRDRTPHKSGWQADGRRRRRHLPCGCLRASVRLGHRPECAYYRPEQANSQRWKKKMIRKFEEESDRDR